MCISPLKLKNPYYGLSHIGYNALRDCTSTYIYIPCGHCVECYRSKQNSWIQRFRLETISNFVAFCTLTYNPESLPHFSDSVVDLNGEIKSLEFDYADSKDVATMVRNLRQGSCAPCDFNNIDFKYVAFSELGGKRGRPHFHLLFFLPKKYFGYNIDTFNIWCIKHQFDVLNNWCRNKGSRKFPLWSPICTYHRKVRNGKVESNYDFHACLPNQDGTIDDVAFYVSKYLFKFSERENSRQQFLKLNLAEDDYYRIHNTIKCRMTSSKGLGSVQPRYDTDGAKYSFVRSCIDRSKRSNDSYRFLKFYNSDGKTFPLGRYFYTQKNLITPHDFIVFFDELPSGDMKLPEKVKTRTQILNLVRQGEIINQKLQQYEPDSRISEINIQQDEGALA